MALEEELEVLIRARYPILYIVTSEENRVTEIAARIAARRQKKLYEWSCTQGMVQGASALQTQPRRQEKTQDPIAALDWVTAQVEPGLFLFKDLHPYLTADNHTVIRRLREIALQLKNSLKTILLVAPSMEIPRELEKEITVLNLPLPTREELSELLDQIIIDVEPLEQVRVQLDDADREHLLQAALGLTLTEAENVFARIIVREECLSVAAVPEIIAEKQQIIRKSGLLEFYPAETGLEHVGGLPDLKDWLCKRAVAFSEEARAFGLPAPKGLLLLGIQGCGKSLIAKSVAGLWQLPLLRFDMGRMFGSLIGSSEENVRKAISVAESVAPTILWIDEIEKAFAGAQSSGHSDGGTTSRVFGTLLTWLAEKTSPVFVFATANDISQLPPELLRKGRLDEIFFVDLPMPSEREEIFRIHLATRGRDPEAFDLSTLVEASPEFSGAEIEQAIISALYDAFYDGSDLTTEHLLAELQRTVPLSRTMHEQITRLREWAAGRARMANAGLPASGASA